jgi:hypothetical protein
MAPSNCIVRALWVVLAFVSGCLSLPACAAPPAPAAHRFALLVGVDQYAQPRHGPSVPNLAGPVNDVDLMKRLLVGTYGFSEQEIVTLTGDKASRSAIESGFRSHLTDNTRKYPGSTVLFFFAGHGSQTADKDGDEGDGVDETLVAYDSRAKGGRDIVDDEIAAWLGELGRFTDNVTVIFDSCHSGDGTRDLSDRPIVARQLPPNPNTDPGGVSPRRSRGLESADEVSGRNPRFSFISASMADELSHEGPTGEAGAERYQGFLTYFLVQALQQSPVLTYERAVRTADPLIRRHSPSQHPQAAGNVLIPFLGLAGDRETPSIRIESPSDGGQFRIGAGSMQGVAPGALLAVYAGATRKLVGESGKLASARVVTVSASSSVAELLERPREPIKVSDKVALVTPFAGGYRLPVYLDGLPGQTASPRDRQVLAALAAILRKDRLIEPAGPGGWAFALQRGCGRGNAQPPGANGGPAGRNCRKAYYVAARGNREAAIAGLVATDPAPAAVARQIADYLGMRARQENLRLLDNAMSPLKGKLRLSLVVDQAPGGRAEGRQELPAHPAPKIKVGTQYAVRIANDSDEDLYAGLLVLGTSGRIILLSPTGSGDLIQAHRAQVVRPTLRAGLPAGIETYKILATRRKDVDFRVLEAGSRLPDRASAFELLLKDYADAGTRDPTAVGPGLDEWTSEMIDIEVTE